MESAVNAKTAPVEVTDHSESQAFITSFDGYYYELAAFADVHKLTMLPSMDVAASSFSNLNSSFQNLSAFQLPKRTFPTFSGVMTEWQGFDDLFTSILSHAPELPDVERFEFLKMSLKGEALLLVSHLALTATNYASVLKYCVPAMAINVILPVFTLMLFSLTRVLNRMMVPQYKLRSIRS